MQEDLRDLLAVSSWGVGELGGGLRAWELPEANWREERPLPARQPAPQLPGWAPGPLPGVCQLSPLSGPLPPSLRPSLLHSLLSSSFSLPFLGGKGRRGQFFLSLFRLPFPILWPHPVTIPPTHSLCVGLSSLRFSFPSLYLIELFVSPGQGCRSRSHLMQPLNIPGSTDTRPAQR